MEDILSAIAGIGFGTILTLFFLYIRLKQHLKEELVDPDIERVERDISILRKETEERLIEVEASKIKIDENMNNKFAELNKKIDDTAKNVAKIQGMMQIMLQRGNYDEYR